MGDQATAEDAFARGWRAGYAGASRTEDGGDYVRGWNHGQLERLVDRARQPYQ